MPFYRAHSLMRSAERRTGLKECGDDEFIPRMDAWLRAAESDHYLTNFGRENIAALASRYAINRLRLEALISKHPEIERIKLPAPIVVTGLPRSGTTALIALIADHLGLRSLPMWEAADPFSGDVEVLRKQRASQVRDAGVAAMPAIKALHDCKADDLADDQELQGLAFGSYSLEWHAHVPGWRDYYLAEDQTPVYRYLKRGMQALSFIRGPTRWVIKCPQHVEQLPALARVFPDALLVVTCRPRLQIEASMRRMVDYIGQHTRARPVPSRYWPARFETMKDRYDRNIHLFPGRLELDLAAWRTDPAGTREMIHTWASLQR